MSRNPLDIRNLREERKKNQALIEEVHALREQIAALTAVKGIAGERSDGWVPMLEFGVAGDPGPAIPPYDVIEHEHLNVYAGDGGAILYGVTMRVRRGAKNTLIQVRMANQP